MAYRLYSAKPLAETIPYDNWTVKKDFGKILTQMSNIFSMKCLFKYRLQNDGHFAQALLC